MIAIDNMAALAMHCIRAHVVGPVAKVRHIVQLVERVQRGPPVVRVEDRAKELAKALAATCVRNTFLEALHAATWPASHSGDYSDVTVVTPAGTIPWEQLARISDPEMKNLMKEVVDKLFTVLLHLEDEVFLAALER